MKFGKFHVYCGNISDCGALVTVAFTAPCININVKKLFHSFITSSALDIIQSSYYIHGPLGDETIFAVLYVSLCYGPYTLL